MKFRSLKDIMFMRDSPGNVKRIERLEYLRKINDDRIKILEAKTFRRNIKI